MKAAAQHLPFDQHRDSGEPGTRHGHDELNFAEFPLVLLAKRPPAGLDTIEYQAAAPHPRTGQIVNRKVTISGAGKYGLPTAQDEDVLIALLYLTLEDKLSNGFQRGGDDDRTVYFTRSQLLHILGWPDTGDYYDRLKKSLRRWKGVMIVYEKWWDPTLGGAGDYAADEIGFNLLDNYSLSDGRCTPPKNQLLLPFIETEPQRARCYVIWNKTPFSSFKNGYVKKIDLDTFFRLPTPAAKRAYRYLNTAQSAEGVQEFDLESFACQHVGISSKYKPSRLRSEVQDTVVKPLEHAAVIEPMPPQRRFFKRDGRYCITFTLKPQPVQVPLPVADGTAALPTERPAATPAEPDAAHLVAELRRYHIGGKAARDFLAAHPAAYIEQKINFLEFLIDTGAAPKSHAGWLRRAIEEDYGIPAGYLPKAERVRKQQVADEAQRRQKETKEAKRRQEEQEVAARKAERAHIASILKGLSPKQHKELEEQAIANADDALRAAAQASGSMGEITRRTLVDREVLRQYPLPN
jgi:Replication initiator protein A